MNRHIRVKRTSMRYKIHKSKKTKHKNKHETKPKPWIKKKRKMR